MAKSYDHKAIEAKWQKSWEESGASHASDDTSKPKYYPLIEFPYPSGAGLHVGHPRPYIGLDLIARKRRREGFNVLYPIGWDAFGLPTENYAIKTGKDPRLVTKENTDTFRRQIKSLGISFDWSREINTTDPKYYKWTQWIFLQLYKHGLAYKGKATINWCPKDKIGLANEEVVDGKCERCGTIVEKREKEQWMLAITKYGKRLYDDLDTVDYIERAKIQQKNWIGPSEGAEILFPLDIDTPHHFVLIHGYMGKPEGNFRSWLKAELEKRGHSVEIPELPNTDDPTPMEQVQYVLNNSAIDANTILVGHSLGVAIALKIAEEKKVARLVSVAGFIEPKFKDKERPFAEKFDWRFDFDRIRGNVGGVIALADTDDNAVPLEQGRKIADALGGILMEVTASKPHFTGEKELDVLSACIPAIKVFTTRADTLYGGTFLVLAPEHPWVTLAIDGQHDVLQNKAEVATYVEAARKKTDIERTSESKEKTGIELKGVKAINPTTGVEIPIWVADYALAHFGTGALFGDAHDERDVAFAKKYGIPLKPTLRPEGMEDDSKIRNLQVCFEGKGILYDSGEFSGLTSDEALPKIVARYGRAVTTYKLRDWVFSRQRYWGEPIPMIHCAKCGWVAVPEDQLPVTLPEVEHYEPTDTGESPLANISDWVNISCPQCAGPAKRETDVMPNWAGSSWYYLRYADPKNDAAFAAREKLDHWIPVDWYNGGMEHTVLHLLYSRFWHKFLFDIGLVPSPEPYKKRTSHGVILAEDGTKMSKSKVNVINPDEMVARVGADALRVYEMFMGPFDQAIAWSTDGLVGMRRFLERVNALSEKITDESVSGNLEISLNNVVKKVTDDIEEMKFNTALSTLMILSNALNTHEHIPKQAFETLLLLLAPFAPHLAEELWQEVGHTGSIHTEPWPAYDPRKLVRSEVTIAVQVAGKTRGTIIAPSDADETSITELIRTDTKLGKTVPESPSRVIYVKGRIINFIP